MEGGWSHLPWFGAFRAYANGWVYQQALGWVYASGTNEDDVWLWLPDWGWLWTNSSVYPYLYSHREQSWLYYLTKDAAGTPIFYHFGNGAVLTAEP